MTYPTAFTAGFKYGSVEGHTCRENPHAEGSAESTEWYAGYLDAVFEFTARYGSQRGYLLARVNAHAGERYSDGWDVVMEGIENEELLTHFSADMTPEQAIAVVASQYDVLISAYASGF